jgi:hypothetical protein
VVITYVLFAFLQNITVTKEYGLGIVTNNLVATWIYSTGVIFGNRMPFLGLLIFWEIKSISLKLFFFYIQVLTPKLSHIHDFLGEVM